MFKYDIEKIIESDEYLEHVISKEEYGKWNYGEKILIHATTGVGKTYFLLKNLYESFKIKRNEDIKKFPNMNFENRKILFLTNRVALKNQLTAQYGEDVSDLIHFMSYQELITRWKYGQEIPRNDMIVADECHYFFSDAKFSSDCDIALRYLLEERADAMIIYLSATPKVLISYLCRRYPEGYFHHKYKFVKENIISNCYTWTNEKILLRKLQLIPGNEKILYFRNNIQKNTDLKNKISSDSFSVKVICSDSSPHYKMLCDKKEYENIQNNECFNCKMLISTTVIDNGVNIHDKDLKHIVLDNILDLDVAVQCIGRKRFEEGEDISLYIRMPHKTVISKALDDNLKKLDIVRTFDTEPLDKFCRIYGREDLSGIIYPKYENDELKLIKNDIKFHKYITENIYLRQLLKSSEMYPMLLLNYMDYVIAYQEDLLNELLLIIRNRLDKILDIKLFGEEKNKIFEAINVDDTKLVNKSSKKMVYEKFFSTYRMPYEIIDKKEGSGDLRGKRYWMLKKKLVPLKLRAYRE